MYSLRKKILFFLFIIGIVVLLYRIFVRSGYEQAIVIEDAYWGVDKDIIPPESFAFIIRRIIPNRIHLHPITVRSRYLRFVYYYSLPPNEILGLDDSFSIKLDLVYVYDLQVEKLPDIFIRLGSKNWQDLNAYIEIKLKDLLYQALQENLNIENHLENGEQILKSYIHDGFLEHINQYFQYDGIVFKKIYIQDIYVPDVEQYNLIIRQSAKYLEKKLERSALIDEAKVKKESHSILFEYEKNKLETLAQLLQKYPELKDYLKIEKLSSQAKFIYVPSDPFWSFQNYRWNPSINSLIREKNTNSSQQNIPDFTPSSAQKGFIDKTPP